jgi:hypothetical protein
MWQIAQNAILTKDNMLERKWEGDLRCYFCGEAESAEHLLYAILTKDNMLKKVGRRPRMLFLW